MKFYLEKIFSCEYTGKSGLDYFAALDSEQKEAEKTQRLFPARLKSKVLKACQFRESFLELCRPLYPIRR